MIPSEKLEKFRTSKDIAAETGVPEFKIRRAAKTGLFRTYHIGNRRKLFLLSEVLEAVRQSAGSSV